MAKKTQTGTTKKPKPNGSWSSGFSRLLLFAIISTFICFIPSLNNNFIINWDDHLYVTEYEVIKTLNFNTIKELFTSYHYENYHPLTNLSNAIEFKIWGLNPKPYHVINLLLHICNVVLVFILVQKLFNNNYISFTCALLMGIHPMHVESVAWISERKDVLYSFFYLFSLVVFVNFLERNTFKQYFISLLLFLCSCLSKSAAVTLPLAIIVILYSTNKINKKSILSTLPYFALSIIFGLIAIDSQSSTGATSMVPSYPWHDKIFLASYAVVYYILRFILPLGLNVIHMYPTKVDNLFPIEYYLAPLVLLGICFLLFKIKSKEKKLLIAGFAFFLLTLSIIIQIVPVGRAIVAERYTYIPYIGISIIVGSIYNLLKLRNSVALYLIYLFFIICGILTFQQTKVWKDGETLFTDAISKTPEVPILWYNRGYFKQYQKQDHKGSLDDFNQAIRLDSAYALAYNNRGGAKFFLKDYEGAIADYDKAILYDSIKTDGFYNRAYIKQTLGDYQGALVDYTSSIRVSIREKKDNAHVALSSRAVVKENLKDYDGALNDYSEAIMHKPDFYQAYFYRGNLQYTYKKNVKAAAEDYKKAVEINPNYADGFFNLGIVNLDLNNRLEGCSNLNRAYSLGQQKAKDLINSNCR